MLDNRELLRHGLAIVRTTTILHTQLCIPLVVATWPRQLWGDWRKQVEKGICDQHIIVNVDKNHHCDDSVPNAWNGTEETCKRHANHMHSANVLPKLVLIWRGLNFQTKYRKQKVGPTLKFYYGASNFLSENVIDVPVPREKLAISISWHLATSHYALNHVKKRNNNFLYRLRILSL